MKAARLLRFGPSHLHNAAPPTHTFLVPVAAGRAGPARRRGEMMKWAVSVSNPGGHLGSPDVMTLMSFAPMATARPAQPSVWGRT